VAIDFIERLRMDTLLLAPSDMKFPNTLNFTKTHTAQLILIKSIAIW